MSLVEVVDPLAPKNGGDFPVIVPFTQATVAAAAANANILVGQEILVLSPLQKWFVVPTATPIATGLACVQGVNGKLILDGSTQGGMSVVVTGLAALKALSGVVGQGVDETTRTASWKAFPYTGTGDNVLTVDATDGSVTWQLQPETFDTAKWRAVADWHVDGSAGSDWNTGASGSKLATTDEIQRRCGTPWDLSNHDVTIHVLTAPSNGRIEIDYTSNNEQGALFIKDESTRTVLASGTLATYAAPSTASKEVWLISVTGISNLSSLVDMQVNFGEQGYARVLAASPGGVGAAYARISPPMITGTGRTDVSPALGIPVVGQSVTIESLGIVISHFSAFHRTSVIAGASTPYLYPPLVVSGFQLTSARINGAESYNPQYRILNSDVTDMQCPPFTVVQWGGTAKSSIGLGYYVNQSLYGTAILGTGSGIQSTIILRSGAGQSYVYVVAQGCAINAFDPNVTFYNFASFDSPSDGIYVHNLSSIYANGWIIGNGNAGYGIKMNTSCQLIASGLTLAIAGTSGDIQIPSGTLASAQAVGRKWDRGGGPFTLGAGGTVDVPVPALPADAIVHAWSNDTVGTIKAVAITTPIVGIRIYSTESELVSGSYEWFSPSTRPGGIVA